MNACGGWILAAAPAVLVAVGLIGFIGPTVGLAIPRQAFPGNGNGILDVLGVAMIGLGLWAAPGLLRLYGTLARSMLAPTGQAALETRVRQLAQTRSETIDSGAAELRRIERDLHDGAQARLVAMGMTLGAAEQLLDSSPDAARALLIEARSSSAMALTELRNLVRGIHPPVLADRGLADAVRALALDSPLRTRLSATCRGALPRRLSLPPTSRSANCWPTSSKHAKAGRSGSTSGTMLGSARGHHRRWPRRRRPPGGTGLRGIERRLAAFDGVLAVASPPGGPTVMNMEIPCELSSPKTSSC